MTMPARTQSATITSSQVAEFNRDGAILLPNLLDDHWVQVLAEGLEYANAHPDGMSAGVSMPLRIDQFPASHSPKLKQLLDDSPIAEIVGSILNAPVRFYMDQMFYKPAGLIAPSAWHQDTCYYNVDGHQLIRAWVCADPVPRNISLEVLRGSHLWNVTYRPPVGMDPKSDPTGAARLNERFDRGETLIGKEAFEKWTYFDSFLDPSLPVLPDIEQSRGSFDILGWDYQPGDVILFHGNIVHSALGELSCHTLEDRTHHSGRDLMSAILSAGVNRSLTPKHYMIMIRKPVSHSQTSPTYFLSPGHQRIINSPETLRWQP